MEGDNRSRALLNLALLIESSPHLPGWQTLPLPAVINNLLVRNWTISALHNNTSPAITYNSVKAIQAALRKAPGDDIRTTGATVAYIVLIVFAGVGVWLRSYSRRGILQKKNFKVEDWGIWISMFLSLALTGVMVYGDYSVSFGSHIYLISWNAFKRSLFFNYISTIIYLTAITVSRTAILLVFLTLSTDIRYRLGCYSVGFFNITIFIVRLCFLILQCHPVDFWNDPMNQACIGNENIYDIVLGCLSCVIDASLMFLPTTIMHGLKLPKKDKYMTLGIFFVGLVATTASIVRIFAVMWINNSADKTFHQPPLGIWSSVEVNLAIACACGPSLRAVILSRTDRNFRRRWSRRPPPVLTGATGHRHAYHHREIVTHRVDSALSNRDGEREKDMVRSRSRTTGRTETVTPTGNMRSPYSPYSPTSRGTSPRIHIHGPQGEVLSIDVDDSSAASGRSNTPGTSDSSNSGSTGNSRGAPSPYMYGAYGRRPSDPSSRGSGGTNSRETTTSRRPSDPSSRGTGTTIGRRPSDPGMRDIMSRRPSDPNGRDGMARRPSDPGMRDGMGRRPSDPNNRDGMSRRPSNPSSRGSGGTNSRDAPSSRDRSWSREGSRDGSRRESTRTPSSSAGRWGEPGGLRVQQPMDENRITVSADTIAAMIEEEEEEERIRGEEQKVFVEGGKSWLNV